MLKPDRSKSKVLGIAVGERSLVVAEVASINGEARAQRAAQFPYPAGTTVEQPAALGEALGKFLRDNGFSARHAVIGVSAKCLMLRPHRIPPADAATAVTMLRLHAESQVAPELGEIVFDYVGQSSPDEPSSMLLVGLPRKRLDRLLALGAAAGLKVASVTCCATALGAATAARGEGSLILSLRADGAELADAGQQTKYVRHLGAATGAGPLVAELRRIATMLPDATGPSNGHAAASNGNGNGTGGANGNGNGSRRMVLWDEVGLDPSTLADLERALGVSMVRGELRSLGGADACLDGSRAGASAIALALPALKGEPPAVDFLRPRLAPPKARKLPGRTLWISAGVAAAVLLGALAYADLAWTQRQIDQQTAEFAKLEPQYKEAKPFVASMEFAQSFQTTKPHYLAAVRDLAQAVPTGGQTYLTSFNLQSNAKGDAALKGDFAGHSANVQDVLTLLDKLAAGGRFQDLKRKIDSHDKAGGSDVTFSITFTYLPRT